MYDIDLKNSHEDNHEITICQILLQFCIENRKLTREIEREHSNSLVQRVCEYSFQRKQKAKAHGSVLEKKGKTLSKEH